MKPKFKVGQLVQIIRCGKICEVKIESISIASTDNGEIEYFIYTCVRQIDNSFAGWFEENRLSNIPG